jgi:hypothetical protein
LRRVRYRSANTLAGTNYERQGALVRKSPADLPQKSGMAGRHYGGFGPAASVRLSDPYHTERNRFAFREALVEGPIPARGERPRVPRAGIGPSSEKSLGKGLRKGTVACF